jgi:AcrR family transcriptional regulator
MEAVASRARAGKATLYRRWSSKADLVVDALVQLDECQPGPDNDVDTGSLRQDLIEVSCGDLGFTDQRRVKLMAGMATALRHDEELARTFHERLVLPRADRLRRCVARARDRGAGEVADGVDSDLVVKAVPAYALFHALFLDAPAEDLVVRVIDTVVLPALRTGPGRQTPTDGRASPHTPAPADT